MEDLDRVIAQAEAASPLDRMDLRDAVAAHGLAGLDAVEPWLTDPRLSRFAARVAVAVGRNGHAPEAVAVLRRGERAAPTPEMRRDIAEQLALLQPPARAARGRAGYEIVDPAVRLDGRPAIRYRISSQRLPGHFNVPREVMDALGIPTDGNVVIQVGRAATGGVVFEGHVGIASGTEIYPVKGEPSMAALASLPPYEELDVVVAKDG